MNAAERLVEKARTHSNPAIRFAAFYLLVHNKVCPHHAVEWVSAIFDAKKVGKGVVIEAFRGSTKSTTFNTFVAWMTGERPSGSSLIIRGTEQAARESAQQIADLIEHNPGWKAVFPHVIPDKDKGWSLNGYEVRISDKFMSYEEWRRQNADRRDPSVVAHPYKSGSVLGMHPSNCLLVDDIHNQDNTSSERELATVIETLTGTIFPCRRPHDPLTVFIGTPWVREDILQRVKETGEYIAVKTAVYNEKGEPTWPERMAQEQIDKERNQDLTGGREFSRMFLLDISASENRILKFSTFPHGQVMLGWPFFGGVDYASAEDPTQRNPNRSHFALAYVAESPWGKAVVYDGVLEQWSQAQGEDAVLRAQEMYPTWRHSVIESDGKGEEFVVMLQRHPNLRYLPLKTRGKRKADRLVLGLGPWLENGKVLISDGDTKFLNALRTFLRNYPNVSKGDPGWDAADAVFWALMGMPHVLTMHYTDELMPESVQRFLELQDSYEKYKRVTTLPKALWPKNLKEKEGSPFKDWGVRYG